MPQFRWFEPIKPVSPEDVFNVSYEMLELMKEPPFGSRQGRGGGYAPVSSPQSKPDAVSGKVQEASESGNPTSNDDTGNSAIEPALPAEGAVEETVSSVGASD